MTTYLRNVLDDLATIAAPHVLAPDLAAASWRAGRRHRVRRRLGAAVAAVCVIAAVVGNLSQVAPVRWNPAVPAEQVVTGYPKRIEQQWFVSDLPDRPGPLAGLLQVRISDLTEWHAFSATGHRWRLPMAFRGTDDHPTISRNGRYLAYLAEERGPYVIHDLVTGKRVEFPDIGANTLMENPKYMVFGQTPSYWSPDSQWLVRAGASRQQDAGGRSRARHLLLGVDGSLRELTAAIGDHLAGWVDGEHLAWYQGKSGEHRSPTVSVTLLDGTLLVNDTLHQGSPWQDDAHSQWAVTLSPDGTMLLVIEGRFPDPALRRFGLASRREVGSPITVAGLHEVCSMSWAGNDPVVSALWPDYLSSRQAVKADGEVLTPLVRVQPEAYCVVLAEAALAGEAHGLIPASWSWSVLWWWQELLAGLIVLAAIDWLRRRRRRRALSGPS